MPSKKDIEVPSKKDIEVLSKKDKEEILKNTRLVIELCEKAWVVIVDGTQGLTPHARWFIISRIVTSLFGGHFKCSLKSVEDKMPTP